MAPKNLPERVSLVEQSIEYIGKDIYDIKNNHLKHMQASLEGIGKDIASLRQTDTKGEWLQNLGSKIIDVIITSLVVGTLVMLGLQVR